MGSSALIWVGEDASNGSGVLFNVTQVPPSTVGRGESFLGIEMKATFSGCPSVRP